MDPDIEVTIIQKIGDVIRMDLAKQITDELRNDLLKFSRSFPCWSWYTGPGEYIDDVDRASRHRGRSQHLLADQQCAEHLKCSDASFGKSEKDEDSMMNQK